MKKNLFFIAVLMPLFSLSIFMTSCEKSDTVSPEIQETALINQVVTQELQDYTTSDITGSTAQIYPPSRIRNILIGNGAIHCTFPPCPCGTPIGFCNSDPWNPWLDGMEIGAGQTLTNVDVENNQLHLTFQSQPADGIMVIPNAAVLSPEISESLGLPSITLVPGEYPIDFSNSEFGETYVEFTE